MKKKLLERAKSGDQSALSELRQQMPASLTVFVMSNGELDVDATLSAWQYYRDYRTAPVEWNYEPTVTLAQAFPNKMQLDPLCLNPVTPGLWSDLWKSENGHELVAAIRYGIMHSDIRESELELRGRVKRHLETPDQFLLDIVQKMKRDEFGYRTTMDSVYAPVRPEPETLDEPRPTPRQQGRAAALDSLEAEYRRGGIDVARYLKLKASLQTEWSHEKYIALAHMLRQHFSLSEIQAIIFELGLSPDDFSRQRNSAALEVADWCKRRDRLDVLADLVKEKNPVRWSEFAAEWM